MKIERLALWVTLIGGIIAIPAGLIAVCTDAFDLSERLLPPEPAPTAPTPHVSGTAGGTTAAYQPGDQAVAEVPGDAGVSRGSTSTGRGPEAGSSENGPTRVVIVATWNNPDPAHAEEFGSCLGSAVEGRRSTVACGSPDGSTPIRVRLEATILEGARDAVAPARCELSGEVLEPGAPRPVGGLDTRSFQRDTSTACAGAARALVRSLVQGA